MASTYLTPPPIAFIEKSTDDLSEAYMIDVVRHGKPGTAMMSFAKTISQTEIEAVVHFVRTTFMRNKAKNTRYHTVENGWENHERYRDAFPFALGEIKLDEPWENLNETQRQGKRLFLAACVSCHDRARVKEEGAIWESYPISWPRNGVTPQNLSSMDAVSGATPYSQHDERPPTLSGKSLGASLFQQNCAFCHAADGSGKNWIGQFIEPHPYDFTQGKIQTKFTKEKLTERISNGVENSAMPAWRYVLSKEEINALVEFLWQRFK